MNGNVTLMGTDGDVLHFAVNAGKYRNITVVYDLRQRKVTAEAGTLTLIHQPENRVEIIAAPEGFDIVRKEAEQLVLTSVELFEKGEAQCGQ